MTVASGFGDKMEGAGAGSRIAVVTNGVDLRANTLRVRQNRRLAGIQSQTSRKCALSPNGSDSFRRVKAANGRTNKFK